MTRHVLLTGLSGAGKTTVGRLMADRLAVAFVDTDAEVVARAGKTVAAIFEEDGEERFRQLETEVLRDALATGPPWRVIAAGGGALMSASNHELASSRATIVWLAVPPEVAATRVAASEDRPLVTDDPAAGLTRLLEARAAQYRRAGLSVNAATAPAEEVCERILKALRS